MKRHMKANAPPIIPSNALPQWSSRSRIIIAPIAAQTSIPLMITIRLKRMKYRIKAFLFINTEYYLNRLTTKPTPIPIIMRFILLLVLCILNLSAQTGNTSISDLNLKTNKLLYENLLTVKKFNGILVYADPNSRRLGINMDDMTNFVKLKFVNLFAGFPIESIFKGSDETWKKNLTSGEYATCSISIRTVGADYPVAYYIRAEITRCGIDGSRILHSDTLGYGPKEQLIQGRLLKDAIADILEDLAGKFLKLHDKI